MLCIFAEENNNKNNINYGKLKSIHRVVSPV